MAEEINARIRHVGKTQAEWLADDTVLLAGELGYATDTQVIKVGNGQDAWRDLKSHQGERGDSIEYAKIVDDELIVKIEGQSEENLGNVRGPQGEQGDSIEYTKLVGDDLIVKIEGRPEVNLGDVRGPQGEQGHSVEYAKIVDNELIIKIENEPEVNLGNVKGDKGDPFTYEDLTEEQKVEIRTADLDLSKYATLDTLNKNTERVKDYVASRRDNLVTNGTGLMKDNTNFSKFEFDGSDAFNANGSFVMAKQGHEGVAMIDEFIPIDPNEAYRMTYYIKGNPHVDSAAYGFVSCYDSDGLAIMPQNNMRIKGSDTQLAQDLNVGDTVIHLKNANNWVNNAGTQGHRRSLIVWNYKNSHGYLYPPYTYSRNHHGNIWDDGAVDYKNNTIKLREPWSSEPIPKNTLVSNGLNGGSYKYIAGARFATPSEWEQKTGTIGGVDYSGQNIENMFAPGTASIKIGWLLNRDVSGGKSWLSNVSFGKDVVTLKKADDTYQAKGDYAAANHTHQISDVDNLQTQLNNKASSTHLHDERYSKIGHTHSEYMLKSDSTMLKVSELTESQYNDLQTKDPNTLYILREG